MNGIADLIHATGSVGRYRHLRATEACSYERNEGKDKTTGIFKSHGQTVYKSFLVCARTKHPRPNTDGLNQHGCHLDLISFRGRSIGTTTD
jgi:hypothetical protein